MSELHIILVKEIEGKPMEADMEIDFNQLNVLSRTEQALALLQAFDTVKSSLVDAEVDSVCDEIKNLVPFPGTIAAKNRKTDIPIK